jgi:hypothetical protein
MAVLKSVTNGGAVADAVDNDDAMDKLIDFLTGVTAGSPILPVIERWTVNKDVTTVAFGAGTNGNREVYLQGPGLSGTDAIYVNIRVYDIASTNVRNWEIRGSTGFDGGQTFANQPGSSPIGSYFTLNRAIPMPFWIVASGRRFICVFKIVATYPSCYCGWYLPYATPSQFPYPMYNGGSTGNSAISNVVSDYTVGNFYDGPYLNTTNCVSHLRHRDGTWLTSASYNGGGTRNSSTSASVAATMYNGIVNYAPEQYTMGNADGSYPVVSVSLYTAQLGGQVYGELDGVFWTPSRDNSAESTITIGPDVYLVVQNMYRASEVNMALLLA